MKKGKKEFIFLGILLILTLDILLNLVRLGDRVSDIETDLDYSHEQVVNQYGQLISRLDSYVSQLLSKVGDNN